jgi:hypothetical protein
MKYLYTFFLFLFFINSSFAQVKDFAIKTATNEKERTAILDCIRKCTTKEFHQSFIFEVKVLNLSKNYAWFRGNASRKDGKEIILGDDYDCCHVEALCQKVGGVWYVVEYGAFSTDLWYNYIWNRRKAPIEVYGGDLPTTPIYYQHLIE